MKKVNGNESVHRNNQGSLAVLPKSRTAAARYRAALRR